jgi:hypothetical protein
VVEFLAEPKAGRVALIEADGDDRAAAPDHTDGLRERRHAAGAFEGEANRFHSEVLLEPRDNVPFGDDRLEPHGTRDLEARSQPIHGVDRGRAR